MLVGPSGYLPLTGDPRPGILNKYTSHSMVRILDLELERGCAENITDTELDELTHLYISYSNIGHQPPTFAKITHLSLRDCVFECDVQSRVDCLRKLSTLESLHLSSCITELPTQINLPVSLRHLTLHFGGIGFVPLPDSMTMLSNLKGLHLSGGMQLTTLPENLNLEKLKLVDCDMTNANSLPRGLRFMEIIHTKRTCNCNKLGIYFNQLADVETLSVTCHGIKFLPSIAGLHNLQELQLKDCFSIKELPPNLDVMVNLCTLNVSGTRIKSLPCSILKLPKLQRLILPKCFQPGSLPLEFRNQSMVSIDIDETDDKYYKDMGYYDFDYDTYTEVDDNITNTKDGVNEVVSKESDDESIISQQQKSPHQLLNQPDATLVLEDFHGSEGNYPIDENIQNQEAENFPSEKEEWTANSRLLNSQKICLPNSEHASQHEHMASTTSEILSQYYQQDSSCGTGNNLLVSENGQNKDNLHREGDYAKGQGRKEEITHEATENLNPRNITQVAAANELEDYNFDGRDNDPINENSHHSICHSRDQEETIHSGKSSLHDVPNVQMPKDMTWFSEEISKESEEGIVEEQQTSPQQLLNLPDALLDSDSNGRNDLIGENSHHDISLSQNQEMEILSSGICDEMITESSSNFQETVSLGKNSQLAVRDGKMDIINSETEHEILFLNQDISSCNERDVSRSGDNLDTLENEQIHKYWQGEGEKSKKHKKDVTLEDIQRLTAKRMKLVDAAGELSISRSTLKRKLKQFKLEWPSSRIANKKHTSRSKSSSQINLVTVGHEYAMKRLDGGNQHILPDQEPNQNCDVIDNSTINTTVETEEVPLMETQLHTNDHELAQEFLNGTNPSRLSKTVQESQNSGRFVVKTTYKEDTVKFVSSAITIVEIKEEVADNLELKLGKFKIKYEDSDKELLLMTKNKHLEDARNLSDSSGSNFLRLFIFDL